MEHIVHFLGWFIGGLLGLLVIEFTYFRPMRRIWQEYYEERDKALQEYLVQAQKLRLDARKAGYRAGLQRAIQQNDVTEE